MKLSLVQKRIEELLAADEWLTTRDVRGISENLCDVGAKLEAAMAKRNICLMIMTPGFKPTSEASKSIVGNATVVVQVIEQPFSNRKRANFTTAQDCAEYIAWLLNLQPLPDDIGVLVFSDPGITSTTIGDKTVIYNCNFKIKTTITNPTVEA